MNRFLLAFLLLASTAFAQTATTTATVAWTAPTTNTDGSAITGTLTYNIYQGPKAGPFTKVASAVQGGSTTIATLTGGPCFAVTAVEGTAESALSNTSCLLVPSNPTSVTISFTVTVK